MATSTWETTAVPILEAIAVAEDAGQSRLTVEEIAKGLGIEVHLAGNELERLIGAGMVAAKPVRASGGLLIIVSQPRLTGSGAQAVGRWPSSDPYTALLQRLEQAQMEATDPERRMRLKKLAAVVAETGRDVLVDVLGAYLRSTTGLP